MKQRSAGTHWRNVRITSECIVNAVGRRDQGLWDLRQGTVTSASINRGAFLV